MNFSKATEATPKSDSTGVCSVEAAPASVDVGLTTLEASVLAAINTVPNSRGNQAHVSFSNTIVFWRAFSNMVALLASGSFVGPANSCKKCSRVCNMIMRFRRSVSHTSVKWIRRSRSKPSERDGLTKIRKALQSEYCMFQYDGKTLPNFWLIWVTRSRNQTNRFSTESKL